MTLPITITTERNYYFSRSDVSFKLNDLGDASCTQVVASSSAALRLNLDLQAIYHELLNTVVTEGEVSEATPDFFDEDGNYRTWKVKGYPTYFNSPDKRYCHIVVRYDQYVDTKKPKLYEEATVVFAAHRLDLYGRAVTDDGKQFLNDSGNAVTNLPSNYIGSDMYPVDETYFYLYIGRISSPRGNQREWEDGPNYGILGTPAYLESNLDQLTAELPSLSVDPEFAQFSWMGTGYHKKTEHINVEIVLPGRDGAQKNNVIDEIEYAVKPVLSSDTTGHISNNVRSVVTKDNGKVLSDTTLSFLMCTLSHGITTNFSSIAATLPDDEKVVFASSPNQGRFSVTIKRDYDLSAGIAFDVTATDADGRSFTRAVEIVAVPNNVFSDPLSAQYLEFNPNVRWVIRYNANTGTMSPPIVQVGCQAVDATGLPSHTSVGYLWYSVDGGAWQPAGSEITVPDDARESFRLRWTIVDTPEALVYDYNNIINNISIGDYFVVGCKQRMPEDDEPDVFKQFENDADAGDDAEVDIDALEADVTAPVPGATPDAGGTIIDQPTDGPSDAPLDKNDGTEPPVFIISNVFELTPDDQKIYIALFDKNTRQVIDRTVVPVIKDGRSVENVRPNLFRNSCFLGQQTSYYDVSGSATFADGENFGSYPVLHLDATDDDSIASITHQADTPLDGSVWQADRHYIVSVWTRGVGQLEMSAQGPLFAEPVAETFDLTDEWRRYSIAVDCKSPASIAGSAITLARLHTIPDAPDAALSLQLACPKLELAETLTDWCLSENDKRGSSLSVHLSKMLFVVKKTSSIWAEEGIDAEEGMDAAQHEVIEAKILYGSRDTVAISSIDFEPTPGIEDVSIVFTEDRRQAVISFIITTDFDVSRITDTRLTFHCDGFDEPLVSTLSFVPAADGADGSQGESGMDAIQAIVFSESGNLRVPENGIERIYVKVYRGGVDITDSMINPIFRWRRVSNYPHDDELWNRVHSTDAFNKPYLDLGDPDIERRAQFECDVTFEI